MTQSEKGTLVGFGLGAIQSGLFLYEAQASGDFKRLVVAEVVPEVIESVRKNNGLINVNIAHLDHIESVTIGPLEVLDPNQDPDRQGLIKAIAQADAITTALPGVDFYRRGQAQCAPYQILADGLHLKIKAGGSRAVIYCAENHNHAAEILQELVIGELPEEKNQLQEKACFLNTVIGKMSGVIHDPEERAALGVKPMTNELSRAILVEAFNRILISRIHFPQPGFVPGINAFIEKDDLLPFEEAKLYGHNATHALAAYLGSLFGVERIADLRFIPGMMEFLEDAFMKESGNALIRRYQGRDPLFTQGGYQDYVDDLLMRMVNPFLADRVDRVGRDLERKLGWDDRLVGTMRLCLDEGLSPVRYALGSAAALYQMSHSSISNPKLSDQILARIWGEHITAPQAGEVLRLVRKAIGQIRDWQETRNRDPRSLLAIYASPN